MIYGIDEAGRGCLCGPVTAACVVFTSNFNQQVLADSKTLTAIEREDIAAIIRMHAAIGIGWAYPHEIDTINIHHASLLAMSRSFEQIQKQRFYVDTCIEKDTGREKVLIDGKFIPKNIPVQSVAIVKGDSKIPEIKAASIIAKVTRDYYMVLLDRTYPMYGFASHKGYPTPFHQNALKKYGISPIHRKSFRTVY